MTTKRLTLLSLLVLIALPAVSGCLKRKEKITVRPDGVVKIRLKYSGSGEDLDSADAMPSAKTGWSVTRTVEKGGEEDKHILTAKRRFDPGEALPSSLATEDDPDADLYLSFPTELTIERRADGVYYRFHRLYMPRKWAYVRYWHDRFVNDEIEELGKKSAEDLSHKERVEILKAFADIAAFEQVEFARAAVVAAHPDLPPEQWLSARSGLIQVYRDIDYDDFVARYQAVPEKERDAEFEKESDEIVAEAYQALIASLRSQAGYDDARLAAFEKAYAREKRLYDITDELGGHQFSVKIKMPGEVIAHNADRWHDEDEGYLVWEFNGDAFRDRPFELRVTSRLPADATEE